MGLTHFPHGVSSFGVPVMGGGGNIPFSTGTYFFVDSVTGSNSNDGKDPDHPFDDIDYAVNQCTADKGDVIIVMPNHTEDIASAGDIDLDVAGITIVGLGHGLTRPTITYSTTLSDIDVDDEDITVDNIYFDLTGVDETPIGIDVNEKNFTLSNCEFLMCDTGGQAVVGSDVGTSASSCKILNTKFYAPDAGAASAVNISATCVGLEVDNCHFDGDFSNAAIYCTSAMVNLNLKLTHNLIRQDHASMAGIDLGASSSSEGICAYNVIAVADSTASKLQGTTDLSGMNWFENYVSGVVTGSGIVQPTGALS